MLTFDDVQAAARRLQGRIRRTPVLTCEALDAVSGYSVYLKCENLQRAGAFKIRGALNKLLMLSEAERGRGVVAFSSGNHAQGVALAAKAVGTTAVICMPTDAPRMKVDATRAAGADIVRYDRQNDDREAMARRIAGETGRVLVPPYDDYAIMAGQGTAVTELLDEVPELDAVLTPVGGGGLLAGCSTAAKALRPGITVIGVETDTANDTYLSFRKGERVTIPPPPTIADGIRLTTPGALTFPILQKNVSDIALVSDAEVLAAVKLLALSAHVVAEPTGAVPVAAVMSGRLSIARGARVGVVISGGNIDPAVLVSALTS
jgi:threonine dehydratase